MRPVRKRKLVDEMRGEWGVSIRRACRVLLVDTSTYHYKSRRAGQAGLEQRIKEICQTRVRYGYRRVHVLLRREGWRINQKKTRRVYLELGLQLRNKTPKRRVKAKLGEDRRNATRPHETWAMDFVHDQPATGQKLRVLTIVGIHPVMALCTANVCGRFGAGIPRIAIWNLVNKPPLQMGFSRSLKSSFFPTRESDDLPQVGKVRASNTVLRA